MVELGANPTYIFDMAGPRNSQPLPRPAEVRRHLLGPLEGRIKCPGPCHRHVRVGLVGAPVVVVQSIHCQDGLDGWLVEDAVVGGHLVVRAVHAAFGAGAVVAVDVDDQRVIELALILDLLNDAANLIVGVSGVGGKYLRFAGIHFLFQSARVSPTLAASLRHTLPVRPAMA